MTRDATVIVHFKDVERSEDLHEALEKRCQHLAEEFNETDRFEISITPDRNEISAHARATGKDTDVAAHATAPEERQAADAALDRLERELRSRHDKRIFAPRREARRAKATRNTG
jgi:ribosome-associated translation inhibitor RaiA